MDVDARTGLTGLVLVGVVTGHVVVQQVDPASSYVPVHVDVPQVAVATQVRLLKVTLWSQTEQIGTDGPRKDP